MKAFKYLLILLFIAVLVFSQSASLFANEGLVIYSGRSDKFVKPVIEEFTRQTGIQVTLHRGKSTALLNKLRVEGSRTEADLFLSNDAGTLQRGTRLHLFKPMGERLISPVSPALRAVDNTWVGLSARARVLVVNTQGPWANKKLSVFDLANPELKDKLGITNSTNGSYIAGVTVYMESVGGKKLNAGLKE
jgi:iron(III) transport system substrate-binding protein